MRLMMQGLTDAAFEQRFGAEDAAWRAGSGAAGAGMRAHAAAIRRASLWAPGRLHRCTALVGDLRHGDGRYQTAADPLFRAMHLMTSTKQGISAIETRPPAGRVLPDRVVSA